VKKEKIFEEAVERSCIVWFVDVVKNINEET
jgi:hypothetical protein